MKSFIGVVAFLFLLGIPFEGMYAQTDKEFWFAAPDLSSSHCDANIQLKFITLDQPAVVTVSEPANPSFTPIQVTVPANQSAVVNLEPFKSIVECAPADNILNYGLHITSTTWIQASYELTCNNLEEFPLKGRNAAGLSFVVPFQQKFMNGTLPIPAVCSFIIVAMEDNTQVTITPSNNIVGHPAGVPFTITLNRGQAYSAAATSSAAAAHLGGSIITADKPIAVTYADDSVKAFWGLCLDLLGDQLIPETKIGADYIIVKGLLPNNHDRYYVYGTVDNTHIYIDGNSTYIATVNRGTYYSDTIVNPNIYIHADEPVYVTHITGQGCELADAVVPPLACTGSQKVAFNHATAGNYYGLIIVPSGGESNFTVAGNPTVIIAANFNPVPGTGGQWMAAQVNLFNSVGPAIQVQNSTHKFLMGFLGVSVSGSSYGYCTDYGPMRVDLGNDTTICPNQSLVLDAAYPNCTYLWQDGTTTQNFTVVSQGTYSVTVTDQGGCTDTNSIRVNYFPTGTVTWNGTLTPQCVTSAPFVLTGGSPPGGSYSGPGVTGNSFNPAIGAGTYNLIYTATDANGCEQSASNPVTVFPSPLVLFNGPLPDQCVTSTTFTLTGGYPTGGIYSGPGVNGGNFDASQAGPGSHLITYTYVDANACINSAYQYIVVHPPPNVSFNGILANQCSTFLTYQLTGGSPINGTYSGPGVTGNNFNAFIAGPGIHAVIYTVSDALGCTNSAVNSITVFASPDVTWNTVYQPMCLSAPSIALTGGTPAGGAYFGPGTGGNSFSPAAAGTGNHMLSYYYIDINGCSNTATNYILVNPLPVPTLDGPDTVCAGSTSLYITQSGFAPSNYNWYVSPGGEIVFVFPHGHDILVTWDSAGTQTVSVNYIDDNGCTAEVNTVKNVTVVPSPQPTLDGPSSVCEGSAGNIYFTEAGMNDYVWNVSAGGTITGGGTSTSSTVTVTWNTPGAQNVSVNYSNNEDCSASTATVENVVVNARPVIQLNGPTSVCSGSSGNVYVVQGGMTNYIWTVSPGGTITSGGTSTSNTVTVTWNAPGAYTVSVNYTDGNGCTALTDAVINVTSHPLPVPTITGLSPVCAGTSSVIYTTETGMTNYLWTVSSGGTITAGGTGTSNTVTVTWNTAGTQTISVNYTNSNQCTAVSATVLNVTVNPLPVPAISGPNPVCIESAGNVYTTQAGMTNYNWTTTPGGSITAGGTNSDNTVTITWITAGLQNVKVNYTNENGCTALSSTIKNVTVNTLPVPTIAGSTSVCAGTSGIIYSTEGGMTGYTWTISPGGTITGGSGTHEITVTWNTAGLNTVSVTYTDTDGCIPELPTSYAVTVTDAPMVNAGPDTISCPGSPITLAQATATNTSVVFWTRIGDGTFIDPTLINATYTPGPQDFINGTFTLILGGAGIAPCGNVSDTVVVTISPVTVAFAGDNDTICAGEIYTLAASSTFNYDSLLWTTSGDGTFDDNTLLHPVYTPGTNDLNNGNVTLTLVAANPVVYCNNASSSLILYIKPLPDANAGVDMAICAGDTIQLNASGGGNYVWVPANGLSDDSIANPLAYPLITTIYTVSVTLNGCSKTDEITVTVRPLPVLSLSPNQHVCLGDSANIWASGASTWLWSTGDTTPSIWVTPAFSQFYYVTGIDAQGCSNTGQIGVIVDPLPSMTVDPAETSICVGEFTIITVQGANTYSWSPHEGLSNPYSGLVQAGPPHDINYTITGTSTQGCKAMIHAMVKVLAKPVLSLPDSAFLCMGDKMTFNAGYNDINVTYLWQDGSTSQFYTVTEPGTYIVDAINPGCHVRDTLQVYPCAIIWVPNAFTPDGDNLNDLFLPKVTTELLDYQIYIFSRKGELVYQSKDIYKGWDGKFKDGMCEPGVFTWMIYYKSRDAGPQLLKGTVTLIR